MILLFDRRYIQLRQVYGFYTFLLNETKIAPNVLLFCLSVCVDKPSVYVVLTGSWFRYTVAYLEGIVYMGFGPYHFGPFGPALTRKSTLRALVETRTYTESKYSQMFKICSICSKVRTIVLIYFF